MSSAPTQLAVAPTAPSLVTSSQIKKDFLEEPPLPIQNSLAPRSRSGLKGKHLTRSHAMRESASPPRTPTPRSDGLASSPVSCGSHSSSEMTNDHKVQVQSSSSPLLHSSSTTPTQELSPSVIVTSQYQQQHQQSSNSLLQSNHTPATVMYSCNENNGVVCSQSQLDVDFPKLTPPKSSKGHRNHNNNNINRDPNEKQTNVSNDSSPSAVNSKQQHSGGFMSTSPNMNSIDPTNGTGRGSNKLADNDGKMSHHNNSNKNNRGNSHQQQNGNLQSPPIKQSQQRRNQSSHSQQEQQSPPPQQQQQQQQHQQESFQQNHHMQNDSGIVSSLNNLQITSSPPGSYDKENRYSRNDEIDCNNVGQHNCNPSFHDDCRNNISESPTDNISKCDRMGKKHRNNPNAKGSKARLKNMGSSSSVEGGNSTSGFISRDSSSEQFTDSSGIDLKEFFKETLSKNPLDRSTLLLIEKDLTELVHDKTRSDIQYPAMSSYNRMLIHRVAAFFGMEHNVDSATPQCVVVSKTKHTRIPSIKFKSLYRSTDQPPRKSILKRDAYSFDDNRRSLLHCPDRGMLDRKSKSYEQREEEYEQVRKRIFRVPDGSGNEVNEWHPQWGHVDSPEHSNRMRHNKLLKVQSLSTDSRTDGRPSVSKSHSFGGYGGPPQSGGGPLTRGDSINSTRSAGGRLFSKQDSIGSTHTPWRLSPSSSGYKTQTQSLRSDSVTPSPTGYGSDDHTPEPCVVQSPPALPFGVVWAVTDMASVPRGSVLINPHTLQPIVNQDGSIYHFDPSNLPPSQAVAPSTYNKPSSNANSSNRKIVDKPKVVKSDINDGNKNIVNSTGNSGGGGGNSSVNAASSVHPNSCNTQEPLLIVSSGCVGNSGTGNITTGGAGQPPIDNNNSIESLSESSAQTVLIVDSSANHDNGELEATVTKEHHSLREMSDIQEESSSLSVEEKPPESTMESLAEPEEKPKLINQATSPNIPSPEPEEIEQPIEEIKTSNSTTESTTSSQSSVNTPAANNSSIITQNAKKDETKQSTSNIPLMSFAPTGYQAADGSTVFTSPTSGPYSATAYQSGPDGSVYAVPQPMVYAYPPPMDGEFQGYFMPVYEQSITQRDPNGLVSAPAPTIYQSAGGPTTVVAYPTASYGGAPLYQGQVVYSPEQFATAGTGGQLQQYPVPSYPMSYTYPYNGYWSQPMTYYVPQAPIGNTVPTSIISQPIAGTSSITSIGNSTHSNSNGTKRNTPPQNSLSSGPNSQSATPASTYQFAPGLPLALATDPNGPTMYAIPQAAVFPNMLPYPPPGTPSAAAAAATGVLSHLPHPQHNAVINPLISTQTSGPSGLPIPLDNASCGGYALSNNSGSHGHNSGTPHSAPSTPLSNPIPLATHQPRNPPLFPTPPILQSGYNQAQTHYTQLADIHGSGIINSYTSSYERKNNNKRNGNYAQNNRQNSYSNNNQNSRRPNIIDSSNNYSVSNSNRSSAALHMSQPKRLGGGGENKSTTSTNNGNNHSNNVSTNNAQNGNNHNGTERSRNVTMTSSNSSVVSNGGNGSYHTGTLRNKSYNPDFRRSVSQRNTPSTNSIESNNNSPNSIASNHIAGNTTISTLDHPPPMYMPRGTHIPPMHPPTAAAVVAAAAAAAANDAACHQQFVGAYNHPAAPAGMYIKYLTHPPMALPNNRRSPPNDIRPQLTHLTGVYPTVNMMLPATRTMPPRQPNPNYKGNKPSR